MGETTCLTPPHWPLPQIPPCPVATYRSSNGRSAVQLQPTRSCNYVLYSSISVSVCAVTCEPAWLSPQSDVNSVGGQLVSHLLSESGCLDYCAYDHQGCVAADVDYNQLPYPACWVHVNAGNLDTRFSAPGVKQHRINPSYPPCRVSTTGDMFCGTIELQVLI